MRLIDADELLKKLPREELVSRIIVAGMPTIDPVLRDKENGITYAPVRRGRWIQKSKPADFCTYWWYECSACGDKPPNDRYGHPNYLSPYCPNCGAKMEGDE